MTTFGKLSEFEQGKEDWTSYIERLKFFFDANDINTEGKQKAILLSACGSSTYKLLRDLCCPP